MDQSIYSYVAYTKLEDGYSLDIINNTIGKPKASDYPPDFWTGLGLKNQILWI